jgi:mannosyltransferase
MARSVHVAGSAGDAPAISAWRLSAADTAALTLLTAVAGAARFVGLGRQSFWVDEAVTHRLVEKSFPSMLGAVVHGESTPPLYYMLAWCWSKVFGSGELALRSLSALVGTVTVLVAFAVAKELVCRRTGFMVAGLAAVSPLLVWYSQEARAYALLALLSALSLLLFTRAREEPSARNLGWWACTSALALLAHYFAVFLVAGEAALLLSRHRRRATVNATAAVAGVGLALLPLAVYQAKYGSSVWIRWISLRLRIEETLGQLLVPSHPSIWAGAGVPEGAPAWWPLGVVLLATGCAGGVWLHRSGSRRGVLTSLLLGIAALAGPIVVSLAARWLLSGRGDVFLFRNAIGAWLPLTIALGSGLTAPRAGRLGLAAGSTLIAASAAVLIVNSVTPHLQRDDWRVVARAVAGPDRAIVLSPSWEVRGLELYSPGLAAPRVDASIREIDVLVRRWTPSYSPTVTVFDPPPRFTKIETRTLQNWVLTVYRTPTAARVRATELEDVLPRHASRVVLERRLADQTRIASR